MKTHQHAQDGGGLKIHSSSWYEQLPVLVLSAARRGGSKDLVEYNIINNNRLGTFMQIKD